MHRKYALEKQRASWYIIKLTYVKFFTLNINK